MLNIVPYRFGVDGKPAFAVALVRASTVVLASSKVTMASAFSRFTSALVTPLILVNDLFTEITHDTHVIPDTDSVTVFICANAAVAKRMVAIKHAASSLVSRFMAGLFNRKALCSREM